MDADAGPRPEAVAAFKEQLGVHPVEDARFGWIAEVGLRSPLPPRWTSHVDAESGFIYYIDHDRQTSSWENPLVPHLRRIVEIGRSYLANPSDDFFEDQKGILWHQHKHALDAWHGPFTDPEGRQYFVNAAEEVSSWQDPRVDAQYIFELESGLLTSLQKVMPPPGLAAEDNPWTTDAGAEVLTLDGLATSAASALAGGTFKNGWRKGATATGLGATTRQISLVAHHRAKKERATVMEEMTDAAKRFQGVRQEEEEAQRLALRRKVEERRRRRAAAATAPTGEVAVRGASKESTARPPQRPPPTASETLEKEAVAAAAAVAGPAGVPLASTSGGGGVAGTAGGCVSGRRPAPSSLELHDSSGAAAVGQPGRLGSPAPLPPESEAGNAPTAPSSESPSLREERCRPPALPPSPLAGKKPRLTADMEEKLRASVGGHSFQATLLGTLALGGGRVAEADDEAFVDGRATES